MSKTESIRLPEDRYYDPEEHLWVKLEDGRVRLGLDELGRWAAGTIAYVDLHRAGKTVARRGGAIGTLEANKFVGAVRSPIRGTIVEANERLHDDPRLVNGDPYGDGWFVVIEPSHLQEDLAALVHGEEAIRRYATEKITEYASRGILPEEAARAAVEVLH